MLRQLKLITALVATCLASCTGTIHQGTVALPTWDTQIVLPGAPADEGDGAGHITALELDSERDLLTVSVEHPEGRPLTVTAFVLDGRSGVEGLISDGGEHYFPTGQGSYSFELAFFSERAGPNRAGERIEVFATSFDDLEVRSDRRLNRADANMHYDWQPDTLYVVPFPRTARVGESVTLHFVTGVTAHPLRYLNGVRLLIDPQAQYVSNSIKPGFFPVPNPGGGPSGIWTALNNSDATFLTPSDGLISPREHGDGRVAYDFTVAPTRGAEITGVEGVLFTAQFTFDAPGRYELSLHEADNLPRTYYSGADLDVLHFWGALDHTDESIPWAVEILEP